MQTSAIHYRVADFLKQHPPFSGMEEADLLSLAARGRVKFYQSDEYILWQNKAHGPHVFVIQQGTVSLWDEAGTQPLLSDVRGEGDLLGIERFAGATASLHSAKSNSDVVIYGFPAEDFAALLAKYPQADQYVKAHAGTASYQATETRKSTQGIYLYDAIRRRPVPTCPETDSIRDAAARLLSSGAGAVGVLDAQQKIRGIVHPDSILQWAAHGGGSADASVANLLDGALETAPINTTVVDGVLAMANSGSAALAITSTGDPGAPLVGIVTAKDLAPIFGEHPLALLGEIRRAADLPELRELHTRLRTFLLARLTSMLEVDWLCRIADIANVSMLKRILDLTGLDRTNGCWCFSGSAGRAELLSAVRPRFLLIGECDSDAPSWLASAFIESGFLPGDDSSGLDDSWYFAPIEEWKTRFTDWVNDPVLKQMYRARPLFDLRAVHGDASLWTGLEAALKHAIGPDFIRVLANDCLASLPPLTFFENAVVDESGEQAAVFRLEQSALGPLVDVGRVFGMAAGRVLGGSTLERFALARTLLPEHESIFREAADTLRTVLWQQGRIGISQGTDGAELPPSLLSRYDRQVLKGGFRSLHRLLEFTAESEWLQSI